MYENVKYVKHTMTGQNCAINCTVNGQPWSIPLDPANTDYQNIIALVESGELTIQPAEEVQNG